MENAVITQSTIETASGFDPLDEGLFVYASAAEAEAAGLLVFGHLVCNDDGEAVGVIEGEESASDLFLMSPTEEGVSEALKKIFAKEMVVKSLLAERQALQDALKIAIENTEPRINKAKRSAWFWREVYGPQIRSWFTAWRTENATIRHKGKENEKRELPKTWKSPSGYGSVKTTAQQAVIKPNEDAPGLELALALSSLKLDRFIDVTLRTSAMMPGEFEKLKRWIDQCPILLDVEFKSILKSEDLNAAEFKALASLANESSLFDQVKAHRKLAIDTGLKVVETKIGGGIIEIDPSEVPD